VVADDLWFAMPVLTGRLVRLEPLRLEHARGYQAAAGESADAEEVFRWLNPAGGGATAPRSLADAVAHIVGALAQRARGERLPYAQIDVATGDFVGTTSLYEIVPGLRTLAIGHTWLGRRWWRTGINSEAKLLLLTYAFDALGAVRVVWHTDARNLRSQEAIERLGATREGLLRKHKLRRDGTWRDTVLYSMTDEEWPAARTALAARLARG
jgi:RimJ/RimL family protein N-acetyltransferase